ncbi:MAG TPA: DivIVA domain-containing protein [Acidimicrobiales bacterium]|nr:DivIVA domain-containing protein [Acidimicrobiales bacterium]
MAIPVHDYGDEDRSLVDFFDADRQSPSFTVAFRGYHQEEVDDYLRQLQEEEAEDAALRVRLEGELDRLERRVAELERCLEEQTPHTIAALGERVELILRHAEEGADQALAEARAQADEIRRDAAERADYLFRQASERDREAAEQLTSARAEADAVVRQRLDEAARQATAIVAGAEQQGAALIADARRRADDIAQQCRDEEAYARQQMVELRARFDEELRHLEERRRRVVGSLEAIRTSISDAVSASSDTPTQEQPAVLAAAGLPAGSPGGAAEAVGEGPERRPPDSAEG